MRRTIPALSKLDKQNLTATAREIDKIILLHRWQDNHQIFSILNFSDRDVNLNNVFPEGKWHKILDSSEPKWIGTGSSLPKEVATTEQIILIKFHSFAVYTQ